ncbi:hypothetical protein BKA70DRAFT_1485031 [Coprinopsis sp. MPI-PUGE-AT-0042]|nr:hypothetical protein BKA70DRAFT_1485031 [Coprinopsis sp. MPI-PUGE-AT-0042]
MSARTEPSRITGWCALLSFNLSSQPESLAHSGGRTLPTFYSPTQVSGAYKRSSYPTTPSPPHPKSCSIKQAISSFSQITTIFDDSQDITVAILTPILSLSSCTQISPMNLMGQLQRRLQSTLNLLSVIISTSVKTKESTSISSSPFVPRQEDPHAQFTYLPGRTRPLLVLSLSQGRSATLLLEGWDRRAHL